MSIPNEGTIMELYLFVSFRKRNKTRSKVFRCLSPTEVQSFKDKCKITELSKSERTYKMIGLSYSDGMVASIYIHDTYKNEDIQLKDIDENSSNNQDTQRLIEDEYDTGLHNVKISLDDLYRATKKRKLVSIDGYLKDSSSGPLGVHFYKDYILQISCTRNSSVFKSVSKEPIFTSVYKSVSSYIDQWGTYHRSTARYKNKVYYINEGHQSIVEFDFEKMSDKLVSLIPLTSDKTSSIFDVCVSGYMQAILCASSDRKIYDICMKSLTVRSCIDVELPSIEVFGNRLGGNEEEWKMRKCATITCWENFVVVIDVRITQIGELKNILYLYVAKKSNKKLNYKSQSSSNQQNGVQSLDPIHATLWFEHRKTLFLLCQNLFSTSTVYMLNRFNLIPLISKSCPKVSVTWRLIQLRSRPLSFMIGGNSQEMPQYAITFE